MLKNYLATSFRNLRKHFFYSVINISGLATGLAVCLLLVTWISHELSYDKFHSNADRIYRASMQLSIGGQEMKTAVSPTALLPALKQFPEIEEGVRVFNPSAWNAYVVKKDDKLFQEEHFYFADSSFFKVFSFKLIKGNTETALRNPNSVILTESSARKYFGNEDPIGKTLNINNRQDYTITGVIQDIPTNSFLQFDFLGSFSSLPQGKETPIWWSANYQTFLLMQKGANIEDLAEKTNEVVKQAVGNDLTGPDDYVRYHFMKLTDIHLYSSFPNEFEVVGDIQYIYIFSAVALLILLIACINYVNLATARAIDRAKEVGIRKVVGAEKKQLFLQFMGESAMITVIAFIIAFFAAQILLPLFNELTAQRFDIFIFYKPLFIIGSVVMLIVIAFLSGAYPALAITAFKPVSILKGNFKFSSKGIWLRKVLVVTQFSISILLIVGTLVILKQLDFIQNKKLGYDKENILILPLDRKTQDVFGQLKNEAIRSGIAKHVGRATESPTRIQGGYGFNVDGVTNDQGLLITAVAADTGFIPTMSMEVIKGRNFNAGDFERAKRDTTYSFIINESMLKALAISAEEAVGSRARLSGRKGEIVGVVNDFHYSTLHTQIGPLVMFSQEDFNHVFIKLNTDEPEKAINKLQSIAATIMPQRPFEYQFLDQQYGALYNAEQRMGTIFLVFATLAIFIACLGLLGLVSFSAAQKTKEIGIRKVLGASAPGLVLLITKDFTKLVLLSICIGIPVSYWVMTQWLSDFAYKTDIGVGPVLIAAVASLIMALGTASFQAIKTALIDPAKTLRNE